MTAIQFKALVKHRSDLMSELKARVLYPWRYDNLLGQLDSKEGLHESWNMTWREWLESHTELRAQSICQGFRLYSSSNCFYVVKPNGEIHGYYGYSAFASFDRHVRGEPSAPPQWELQEAV